MTWPLPQPDEISERYSSAFEGSDLFEGADARSPNTVFGILSRTSGSSLFELYLYQRSLADELMPDMAQDWLYRHADIWGVPRIEAKTASGQVVFAGSAGLSLASGIELQLSGVLWSTMASATLDSQGAATVPVRAQVAGTSGNVAAGSILSLVSPISGLTSQTATVGADGLTGGAEIEKLEVWRARILKRIRQPPHGGKATDYEEWAAEGGAAYVNVVPSWAGAGSVGVVVAMSGPRVPTSAELAAIAAAVEAERPVTAEAFVVPAVLRSVPILLEMNPDTAVVRAAAEAAIALFFQQEQTIAGTLYLSRLSEAISSAAGEYSHRLLSPTGNVVPERTELLVPSIAFQSPA